MLGKIRETWTIMKNLKIGNALAATVATHVNSISVGMCQGYSAVLLPQLEDPNSSIQVTEEEESWIASLGVVTNPLGALLAGFLMEWLGRKKAVHLVSVPFLLGWLIIALSPNLVVLYIGRAITGVAIGMAATCYVYVAEISLPEHRGFLSSFGPIFVSTGVLFVYTCGALCSWQVVSAACALSALLSGVVMFFIPESPSWLLKRGQTQRARRAVLWLRGDTTQGAKELEDLSNAQSQEKNQSYSLSQFTKPFVWKPFLILMAFFLFQEGSGMYIMLYYAVNFFKNAGGTMDDYVLSIIVASVRLVMSIIGTVCIKVYNRRTMACVSGAGMAVFMGTSGTYEFFYGSLDVDARPLAWIPQLCVIGTVASSMLGMLQLPWVMIGELFPTAVRGIMGGIVSSLGYLFIFGVVQIYPQILEGLKEYGMMWMFALISLLVIPFVILFLPETQGKSLLEIEAKFKGVKISQTQSQNDP